MINNVIFRYFRNIDIFGKDPQFYYKKNEKKKSNIGSIFTIIYIILYVSLFTYKLYRMINKKDGVFTDSNLNPEKYESIHLTNENFYLGFAIEDPVTYDTIFDNTIYYVKAYYKKGVREGNNWDWEVKELETEQCKLEKFGSKYQNIFSKKNLNVHHCFKEMDYIMEGHFSYDLYSMLYISLFPCKNTTENGNHCKPIEVIDYYLKGTFIAMQIQDILLTPEDYNNPVKERDQDIYTTVGKKLFKEMHVYFKITNIETDTDIIGIDEIKTVRNQKYIKYDSFSQMTKLLETNIYETGESFCDITLKLSDLVFYQKRKYTKVLQILEELGGLMEIIMTIIRFFLSYYVDKLYDIALVNSLFKFEFENELKKNEKIEIEEKVNKNKMKNLDLESNSNKEGETYEELKVESNKYKKPLKKKKKIIIKKSSNKSLGRNNNRRIYTVNNQISTSDGKEKIITTENNDKNYESNKSINKNNSINKITYNKFCFYCFFFCHTKRKTKENKLLEEGMDIIKDNLDIINIFKQINKNEKIVRNFMDKNLGLNLCIHTKKLDEKNK